MGVTAGPGNGGGTYSGFKNRARKRQDDLAALFDPAWEEDSTFPDASSRDLAALLLGQKGAKNGGSHLITDAINRGKNKKKAQQTQLDPNIQRLLDAKNRDRSDKGKGKNRAQPRIDGGRARIAPVARNRRRQAINQQQDNITDYLQDYLAEKMATVGGTFDYESALRDSEKAIRQAYQRDIKAIQGSSKAARRDTRANRKDVEALYAALARSYEESGQDAIAQGQQLAEMMQAATQGAQDSLSEAASGIASQQAELTKGLGIEDAAVDWMPQQAAQTQEQLAEMAQEGAEDSNRQLGYAGNQAEWLQRGGQNAMLEGTNRSAELIRDMQDYIQGNRTKAGELRSMRDREIGSNKDDIMGQVAEMQAQQDQQLWEQLMGYSEHKLDIEDTQADNDLARRKHRFNMRDANRDAKQWAAEQGLDRAKFGWDKKMDAKKLQLEALKAASRGEEDAESWVPGYFEDYSEAIAEMNPKAASVSRSIIQSKPFQTGEWYDQESKREFDLNPTSAAALAEQMAKQQGITNQKQLALIRLAAMVYAKGGV